MKKKRLEKDEDKEDEEGLEGYNEDEKRKLIKKKNFFS